MIIGNSEFQHQIQKEVRSYLPVLTHTNFVSTKTYTTIDYLVVDCENLTFKELIEILKKTNVAYLFNLSIYSPIELETIHLISIECNSTFIQADSYFFNPIINTINLEETEFDFVQFNRNRYNSKFCKHNFFQSLEFCFNHIKSEINGFTTKLIQSETNEPLLFTATLKFNNTSEFLYKWSNTKIGNKFELEIINANTTYVLDLLTFNAENTLTNNVTFKTKGIYTKNRSSLGNLFRYTSYEKPDLFLKNKFKNTIKASQLISDIEQQLRNEVPNFTHL